MGKIDQSNSNSINQIQIRSVKIQLKDRFAFQYFLKDFKFWWRYSKFWILIWVSIIKGYDNSKELTKNSSNYRFSNNNNKANNSGLVNSMGHQLWRPLLPRQSALLSTSKYNSVIKWPAMFCLCLLLLNTELSNFWILIFIILR